MTYTEELALLLKARKVFTSCVNKEQWAVAEKYMHRVVMHIHPATKEVVSTRQYIKNILKPKIFGDEPC